MLLIHLDEAAFRAGDVWAHGKFRVIQLSKWLREAGLVEIRQKPTLMVRFQPLRPIEKQFVCEMVKGLAMFAETINLPAEELQLWREMSEADDRSHSVDHPDFQSRAVQTVFVGQVP